MFSGLIREIAKVKKLKNNILELEASYEPEIGDSIAVNGVCLTVISKKNKTFSLEISKHTQEKIALENYHENVHIEPALQMISRLDGHLVQGHVDGIGVIQNIQKNKNQVEFFIKAPQNILRLCIPHGSITIDGISLTLAEISHEGFKLIIIPHTFENTLFKTYQKQRRVNIETDMLVRSIDALLSKKDQKSWTNFDDILMSF
ncbi:riboflavin synthase [Helicobacter sp. faydin-H20]|uniref:riboflavin synthase n=1 Tax=Helicobacter anatolicus TaxID=2905874 RepID=UPI001E623453|nr:riboflavin synthase [Helicobacter anatolicus]MCE3036617.1 riboflavin synthase [Helicobacter anatolicus]